MPVFAIPGGRIQFIGPDPEAFGVDELVAMSGERPMEGEWIASEEGTWVSAFPTPEERIIDGNNISIGTAERLTTAESLPELRDALAEILLGRDVAG